MARYVKVSALAPAYPEFGPHKDAPALVNAMIRHLDDQLTSVLCDQPDLVVLPEVCDRPANLSPVQRQAYYAARGDQIRDHLMTVARQAGCNIAYSADRSLPDGSMRNSTQFINRQGGLDGIYNKNHLVTTELEESGILYGKDAPLIRTDFGTLGAAICFDLNFKELRQKYEKSQPELLVFSSMYHGGLVQNYWAYSCRSWFIGSVAGNQCTIINPLGDLVARSTNYYPFITADINLDYKVAHIAYNEAKFAAAKQKYGSKVRIYDPGHVGAVLLTSESDDITAHDLVQEFAIELWDDYYARSLAHRQIPGHIES